MWVKGNCVPSPFRQRKSEAVLKPLPPSQNAGRRKKEKEKRSASQKETGCTGSVEAHAGEQGSSISHIVGDKT
jgi:hypothetical protein